VIYVTIRAQKGQSAQTSFTADNQPVSFDTRARALSPLRGARHQGFDVAQSLELNVWLGLALLAFTSAHLLLWRTRRVLSRARRGALVQEVRHAPTIAPLPSAVLAPAAMTKSVGSVVA
jgi:hypothetical protein